MTGKFRPQKETGQLCLGSSSAQEVVPEKLCPGSSDSKKRPGSFDWKVHAREVVPGKLCPGSRSDRAVQTAKRDRALVTEKFDLARQSK